MRVKTNEKQILVHAKRKQEAVITLDPPEEPDYTDKGSYETVKLYMDPSDTSSATYSINVHYFRSGQPESFLLFRENLEKVLKGQDLKTAEEKFAVARRLLKGDALTAFNSAAATAGVGAHKGAITMPNFNRAMAGLTRHVFPLKAAQKQQRWMRRYIRKPIELNTREWVARIREINEYLPKFPEIREGVPVEKLPDDALLDILDQGIPAGWVRQMIIQGFDPIDHTIDEFVDFCERQEETDTFQPTNRNKRERSSEQQGKSNFQEHPLIYGNFPGPVELVTKLAIKKSSAIKKSFLP